MTLGLQNRRMEEDLAARRKNETELAEKLLEQEHNTMELRFEREQARARISRLENRLLELELVTTTEDHGGSGGGGAAATARAAPSSRQVRGLEQVVEGLERVITQQKTELKRARDELEGRKDDRRHKAEVARLRKKVNDLEEELGSRDLQHRKQSGLGQQRHAAQELEKARKAQSAAQAELQMKEAQIAALERDVAASRSLHPSSTAATEASGHGGGAGGAEAARMEAEP